MSPIVNIKPACAALIFAAAVVGCDSDEDAQRLTDRFSIAADNITSVSLSSSVDVVEKGRSVPLSLVGADPSVSYASRARWHSSDSLVATVSDSGVVTGVADGTATINARFGPFTETVDVRVSSAELTEIQIAVVEPVNECGSVLLTANGVYASDDNSVRPLSGVVWTASSTPSIGVFSSTTEGLFRSDKAGSVTMTATRDGVTDQTTVVVNDNLEKINITPLNPVVTTTTLQKFEATAEYSDADDQQVITDNVDWQISNSSIATVDNTLPVKGTVTGVAAGRVVLTASCGGATAQSVGFPIGDPDIVRRVKFANDENLVLPFNVDSSPVIELLVVLDNGEEERANEEFSWSATGDTAAISVSDDAGARGKLSMRGTGVITVTVEYDGDKYDEDNSILNIISLKVTVE